MPLGIYGKHPAKGDFLDFGVAGPLLKQIEVWLDAALAEARETLGGEWETVWGRAPVLRFWLGEAIWGGPLAGVMVASRDKVGRRFPLVMLASGPDVPPPPVIDVGQGWHEAAVRHLTRVLTLPDFAANAALVEGGPQGPTGDQPGAGDFWAVRPGNAAEALWADVALTDHRRAAAGRSYWWVAGEAEVYVPDVVAAEPADEGALAADPVEDAVEELAEDRPQETDALPADPVEDDEIAVQPPEADPWEVMLPDLPEDEDSPFDAAPAGVSLFAPPAPAIPAAAPAPIEAAQPPRGPALRAPLWSQVWAGEGLPSGAVLAWFFRGHVGNG